MYRLCLHGHHEKVAFPEKSSHKTREAVKVGLTSQMCTTPMVAIIAANKDSCCFNYRFTRNIYYRLSKMVNFGLSVFFHPWQVSMLTNTSYNVQDTKQLLEVLHIVTITSHCLCARSSLNMLPIPMTLSGTKL